MKIALQLLGGLLVCLAVFRGQAIDFADWPVYALAAGFFMSTWAASFHD